MKVVFNGKIKEIGRIDDLISGVVDNVAQRIGVPEGTALAIEGLEFKVVFTIDGEETYASVPREVNGETINEMFMISVHLDEEGNVIQAEDNEGESFYDGFMLAKSIGQEYNYEGIESKYENDELEVIDSMGENTENDVMAVRYSLIADPLIEIVRHYKGNRLVAEYRYEPKEIKG